MNILTHVKHLLLPAALALSVAAGGCAGKNKKNAPHAKGGRAIPTNPAVTDISPLPMGDAPAGGYAAAPAAAAQPQFEPVPATPAITETPAAPGAAPANGSYTVKKGDTLFGIARNHYGNGNQWQRIAAANPGVSPSRLLVGQTITLP